MILSGSVMRFNPQSRSFTSQGPNGKWQPKGPVKLAEQGVSENKPQAPPGPQVLAQKPTSTSRP